MAKLYLDWESEDLDKWSGNLQQQTHRDREEERKGEGERGGIVFWDNNI